MGISLSSCVSGTRFFQQVVMSAGLYGDCLITVGNGKWVVWQCGNKDIPMVSSYSFTFSMRAVSCLLCNHGSMLTSDPVIFFFSRLFRSSLPWWTLIQNRNLVCGGTCRCWETVVLVWDAMNLHEQGRSREVCINVGLCLQSSSSTTGSLPKSEGKRDE